MTNEVMQMKSQASDMAEDMTSEGKNQLNDMKSSAGRVVDELSSSAQKNAKFLSDEAKSMMDCAMSYARNKPVKALGITLAATYILKRMMR